MSHIRASLEKELSLYHQTQGASPEVDPKGWWASHATSFPLLRMAAVHFTSVPATSSTSTELFRAVGTAIPTLRASMSHRTVGEYLFLRQNLPSTTSRHVMEEKMEMMDYDQLNQGPDSEGEEDFFQGL